MLVSCTWQCVRARNSEKAGPEVCKALQSAIYPGELAGSQALGPALEGLKLGVANWKLSLFSFVLMTTTAQGCLWKLSC